MYNIIDYAPAPRELSSDHIAEFAFTKKGTKWVSKQQIMYQIKNECTRQGLRNGTDYLFLNNRNDHYDSIRIYFEDTSYVTYMTMWYELNKESE